MKRLIIATIAVFAFVTAQAQTGCPGCQIDMSCIANIPQGGPCDTILPDAQVGVAYDYDVTFYMPPVLVGFPGAPGDVRLKRIKVLDIIKEPFGMQWETSRSGSNNEYFPQQGDTVGCIKICGSPLVAGTYYIDVVLEADVNVDIVGDINNVAQVYDSILMVVQPSSGGASSFTYSPNTGCDTTTVDFETTFPSNGISGYSYLWEFGNGNTSTSETPPSQTYPPGTYEVVVTTTIDTVGYFLENFSIQSMGCNDCTIFGCTGLPAESPDPQVDVFINLLGTPVLSYPERSDQLAFPISYTVLPTDSINPLQNIIYYIDVEDVDGGVNGANDPCGTVSFNGHTEGTFTVTSGSLEISITISHPVIVISDTIELVINEYPPTTTVFNLGVSDTICAGDTTVLAVVNDTLYAYQWFNDTTELAGLTDTFIYATQTGDYFVRRTNVFTGCAAYSDTFYIHANPSPPNPVITQNGTNLVAANAGGWKVQWYLNGNPVPGANTAIFEPASAGVYSVEYFNSSTGCNKSSNGYLYTSVIDLESVLSANVYPNPNDGQFYLDINVATPIDLTIQLYDITGRMHYEEQMINFAGNYKKNFTDVPLNAGMYLLKISSGGETTTRKVIVR